MKKLLICCTILLNTLSTFAQGDYFIIDSVKIEGITLRNRDALGNSQLCEQIVGEGSFAETVTYTPDQIKEFGFANGQVYVSRQILDGESKKWVFLERIFGKEFSLYILQTRKGRRFFLESNEMEVTELAEDNYRPLLRNVMDSCPLIDNSLSLVKLRKYSLLRLLSAYEKCEMRAFPTPRWGVMTGISAGTLSPREIKFVQFQIVGIEDFVFNYKASPTIGLFVDLPVNASEFSVHAKLYIDFFNFALIREFPDYTEDIEIDYTSINFPFLYRYTFLKGKIRPFLNGGGIFSSHLSNNNIIFQRNPSGDLLERIELTDPKILHDTYLGYVIGGGFIYDLNPKHAIYLDIQYHRSGPLGSNLSVAKQGYLLLLGYSF